MKKTLIILATTSVALAGCIDQLPVNELTDNAVAIQPAATKCNDTALHPAVCQILQEKMNEWNCTNGIVYVVETSTGTIKAHVSLTNKNGRYTAYKDTFEDEQRAIMAGPSYLALLASEQCSAEDTIDTGNGIYKNVRDYNWSAGGYGKITLEQALCYHSQVAFSKAKEKVFAGLNAEFDHTISKYMANNTDTALGLLTFYNAVANDGRMVQLRTEGEEVVVNEQMARPEHIKKLQRGLAKTVTNGIFRTLDNEKTTLAACGRTIQTGDNDYRMELCGYFPTQKPQYTIMVILEKKGLPASSSIICGRLMAEIIDLLTDKPDVSPMLEQ